MKNLKRLIKGLMFCLFVVCMINLMPVEAAPKIQLNKTKITVYVGKTYKLKVKGAKQKVKWSSSNRKTATVSSNGKVTGKRAGNAIITAKAGNKKLKCRVNVKSVLSTNKTAVKLSSGETAKVNLTLKKDGTISYKVKNPDIVSCSWGKWTKDTIPLTIRANSSGSTTITISNTYNKEKIKINVTVQKLEEDIKISLSSKTGRYNNYFYSGTLEQTYELTGFHYDVKYYKYDSSYTVHLYFDGKKLYDYRGSGQSAAVKVGWKLYKDGSLVVASGTAYSTAIAEGESFVNASGTVLNLKKGNYELKVMDVN